MAEDLPPGTPEIDDPLLVADLIALLSIKGAIGRLPLADIVIPVVNLGDVVTPEISVLTPSFRSTDVFSQGVQVNPAVATILADTGQLVAGIFDIRLVLTASGDTADWDYVVEHRNAANAVSLMTFSVSTGRRTSHPGDIVFAYEVAVNERLRIINAGQAPGIGVRITATIFARRRT